MDTHRAGLLPDNHTHDRLASEAVPVGTHALILTDSRLEILSMMA